MTSKITNSELFISVSTPEGHIYSILKPIEGRDVALDASLNGFTLSDRETYELYEILKNQYGDNELARGIDAVVREAEAKGDILAMLNYFNNISQEVAALSSNLRLASQLISRYTQVAEDEVITEQEEEE